MEKSIGAFWIKKSKKGLAYLSGEIEIDEKKIRLVVFKNTKKEKENHPDYHIYLSQPMNKENEVLKTEDFA